MRVVYIDSLFLLNFLLDYLALLLTGKVAGEPLRRLKIALGALGGAIYAVSIFWPGWSFLSHFAVRLSVGLLMVMIAYGTTRRLLRVFLLFLAVSAGLGGGVYALSCLGAGVDMMEGVATTSIDLRLIILGGFLAYSLLSLAGRKLARHGGDELRRVEVSLEGKAVSLTALVDSGNTLTDPVSGRPVLVAEGERLSPLLPPEVDIRHPAECFPILPCPQKFRLLPYRAVGVSQGLLLAVRADRVVVEGRESGNRLVALSPTPVSDGGGYQALIHNG